MKPVSKVLIASALLLSVASCRRDKHQYVPGPDPLPVPDRKELLVTPFNNVLGKEDWGWGLLQSFDYNGNLQWERNRPKTAVNLQRWGSGANTRYSYIEYDPSFHLIKKLAYVPGEVVLTDSSFNEIKRIRLKTDNLGASASTAVVDGHDFIYINDNHYLLMAYIQKEVNNIPDSLRPTPNRKVVTAYIQEVQNGQVIWEWDGTDYPEFYTTSIEGNNYSDPENSIDYMHINSMFIDPRDNNLICSFRNLDQVLKIQRGTGRIMWRLGGKNSDFPMTGDQYFLRQHHATLVDNNQTLLLFDNGHMSMRPYSRILEFKLNEKAKTITSFKSLTIPKKAFAAFMGSVQKLDSTYFIGCGSAPWILEINHINGNVVLEKELVSNSYRAFKY
jgi:hypothetical protein